MPPPLPSAVLPDTGLLVNVAAGAVPALARPPPLPVAVLPLRLLPVRVTAPKLTMPPPSSADFPLVNATPVVTVRLPVG
jgi:hypothetical protein